MNGYFDWGHLVCPAWPNMTSPSTKEEAASALHYKDQKKVIPCVWTNSRYDEDNIPIQWRNLHHNDAGVAFRVPDGKQASKALNEQLKNFRCLTHDTTPTKGYIRRTSLFYAISREIRKFWVETYVKKDDSIYGMQVLVMERINHANTIRNMWNAD